MKKKGFSLVEILVVCGIIAIIAGLLMAAVSTAKRISRNSTREKDAKTFQAKLEAYYLKYKYYPSSDNVNHDPYNTVSGVRGTLNTAGIMPLTEMTPDPSGQGWRMVYCRESATNYMLYVQPEPNAAVAPSGTVCGPEPAGAIDYPTP